MKFTRLFSEDFLSNIKFKVKSTGMFVHRLLTSNEHIMWLQSSPWSAIILMKWKVPFAVDGCRRSSFKDFDSHEAH